MIRELKDLVSEKVAVEVKGAYVTEDGSWTAIEDLPESAFLNESNQSSGCKANGGGYECDEIDGL